ncbi:hypothetical protein PR202_ga22187 [Eleusine coracana subsp. coracana]|uniref:Retrotransposon gag domain-containing protein n=1 Tax=Eleusine coracana subsp. coracana TaxID=191504 RepID=A0AAV5D2P7_ELECO|nr:hypothetical protein PR202_ga22187 [Eleusine coracana subsp. coracana]
MAETPNVQYSPDFKISFGSLDFIIDTNGELEENPSRDNDEEGDREDGHEEDGCEEEHAEEGHREENPQDNNLLEGHRCRPRGSRGSHLARRLDLGQLEIEVDSVKFYGTTQNNITGAKMLLDNLMADAAYQTPTMQKAVAMLKAAAAQDAARDKSQSMARSSHATSRYRRRHEDLRNSLSIRDGWDTINSHYKERAQDDQCHEEEHRDLRTGNRREDQSDPPPRNNRDDRRRRDNRDRHENHDGDSRRHRHDDDVGPCHNRCSSPSPDRYRTSTTPSDEEFDGIKAYVPELRIAQWPRWFKPVSIEKYEGQTNTQEWLQLYSKTIWSAGGDTFVMANYLPVCLDPAVRIWLTSLLEKSVTSWGDLNRKLIKSFQATCNRPGNHFDLSRVKQKSDEPLRDYIKRFCTKKTEIPNVPNQQIIAAFQGGIRSDDLVREIGRRNDDLKLTARECFEITDKFASGESALEDIHGKGKEKHSDKSESSNKDKKRKSDNMVATVDRSQKNPQMNQQTRDDLLSGLCLWHPKGNHKARDCYRLKGFVTAALKRRPSVTIELRLAVVRLLLENSHSYSGISDSKDDDSATTDLLDDLQGIVDAKVARWI